MVCNQFMAGAATRKNKKQQSKKKIKIKLKTTTNRSSKNKRVERVSTVAEINIQLFSLAGHRLKKKRSKRK